jgi:acetyl esterase/lipase
VVLIHGGGWLGGDKAAYRNPQLQRYLDAGISVAAINYRLIPQAMEQGIKPPVKAPLQDAARAVQTLRSKAKEWNIDPTRVAAVGGSAGACTSLWLALHDDLADPQSSDPIARQSTRLQCVAVQGAQTSLDPQQLRQWIPNAVYCGHAFGYWAPGRQRAEEFELALKHRAEILPWIREYSPIEHVSAADPPLLLLYSTQDKAAVTGQKQTDPTHSAIYGIELQKVYRQHGLEAHVVTPQSPSPDYRVPWTFVIEKLKAK